ncbi:hypothetical protein HanXRQr2_Chr02g0080421 [Helianthus annuus]|uniref:Uncharacterized protein n=1 Tax=Helianthus annuus TaxID=4232 RepID=A0A9K3JQV0_HELAN|nr:hypothetical protein HanXRQr2_Chr02g0080421 [Helianthus annuus]
MKAEVKTQTRGCESRVSWMNNGGEQKLHVVVKDPTKDTLLLLISGYLWLGLTSQADPAKPAVLVLFFQEPYLLVRPRNSVKTGQTTPLTSPKSLLNTYVLNIGFQTCYLSGTKPLDFVF